MERRPPSANNPFIGVAFEARDLVGSETGGGSTKQFCSVDQTFRADILRKFDTAISTLASSSGGSSNLPRVVALKLRSDAVAKSHRPLDFIVEAGFLPAGHAAIDEVLVGIQTASIERARAVILERDTAKIRANLSTIVDIIPWAGDKKTSGIPDAEPSDDGRNLFLELFSFDLLSRQLSTIDPELQAGLISLLEQQQISFSRIERSRGAPLFVLHDAAALDPERLAPVLEYAGVRSVCRDPAARSNHIAASTTSPRTASLGAPPAGAPVVAVFDTGIAPTASALQPWIASSEQFVLPPDTDFEHGTFVSSLVANAASLNDDHPSIPQTGCLIHDVCGLESSRSFVSDLMVRIGEAVANRPDLKVWNLSLGTAKLCSDDEFSIFGRELDKISDRHNVLFVVAAGNYLDSPRRSWPPTGVSLLDRVCGPADSVRSLTVGALAHLDSQTSFAKIDEPACYSRRGPGPVFTPKPDIVHIGGNVDSPWDSNTIGIGGLLPDNSRARQSGTSFASPIAAALAARSWAALEGGSVAVDPALVKAVLIHSAELASPPRDALTKRYYGSGIPKDPLSLLYDSPDSFTMYFRANLTTPAQNWRKDHFPIPTPLLSNGKLRAEVIMTTVYNPPLDPNAGAEYIRANVETAFGVLSTVNGKPSFKGKLPAKGELGSDGYEKAQIEHGGKWASVKVARKIFPQGISGTHWALQANLLLRALELPLAQPLPVHIFITLRAIDPAQTTGTTVYDAGVQALQATNWIAQALPVRLPISVPV